uniref:Uncharacterized protein n=1 Tax=Amphilophus citrinellus TaxID=61819 RepID=A0A3Q0S6L6_AMPCI
MSPCCHFPPNSFPASVHSPVVSSALSSVANKWDPSHEYFGVFAHCSYMSYSPILSSGIAVILQLFLSVPAGVGQVYGCDSPWTGGLILLSVPLCSTAICFHAMLGSDAVMCGAWFALAAPHGDIYTGLWGHNSALSCSAIGGVFYVIAWVIHLLALLNFPPESLALPACTWPFCLSTLIFLLISSEISAICRLPLSAVSYPEVNRHYQRQLKRAVHSNKRYNTNAM